MMNSTLSIGRHRNAMTKLLTRYSSCITNALRPGAPLYGPQSQLENC
jgi:hypothetical protein